MREFTTKVMQKFILLSILLISTSAFAQTQFMGCHQINGKMPKPKALTDAEKAMMQASILRSDTFDIVHYDIHLDVTDESNQFIEGWATVSYSPKFEDLNSITLDLFELNIDSIVDDSGPLEFIYDDEFIHVVFDASPAIADTLDLTVYYNGNPHKDPYWGGFYFELGYVYNLGIGLTSIPPNFGKVWYPCFDTFLERASYEYHITSANDHIAMCQGQFIEQIELGGDTIMRHYLFDHQIPTYLSGIAVSDYESFEYTHTGAYGDIPVMLTARAAQMTAMQNIFVELNYAIDACEYWFGPYAWDRVGYIMTTDGALEIAENIAYPNSMVNASLAANGRLFTHELGHHWWGDVVTLAEHNHMWIKEGPAEYSAHLFVEFKDGEEDFIEVVKDNLEFILNQAHIDDNGYHPMSPMPDAQIYGRHTYYKGAAVLHNLRGYLGDELFRQAMTGVQENYAYTSFYPDEFKDALEDQSGVDLDPFFDAWIYQPGYSVFTLDEYTVDEASSTVDLVIQQKLHQADDYHDEVPLHVGIVDQDWNVEDHIVTVGGQQDVATITTEAESVEMVILNNKNKLNQARLDYTVRLYEIAPYNQQLPWVNFRLEKEELVDSALVRVEHVWAAPDNMPGEEVWDIGDRHYWRVDGVFPEEYWLSARIMYDGVTSDDLDYDIVGVTEEDLVLVYRPDPSENFEVYSDYTLLAGNLTSSTGTIKIDVLLPGEYALANGDPSVHVEGISPENVAFAVYPNPAEYELTVSGYLQNAQKVLVQFLDESGRLVKTSERVMNAGEFKFIADIQTLSNGHYVMSMTGAGGALLDSTGFQVRR